MEKTFEEMFGNDAVDKQIKIVYEGGEIGEHNIKIESMTIKDILCGQEALTFGECNASCMEITVINDVIPLKGKELTVLSQIEGINQAFQFGKYKVESDQPTADRRYRDIMAYDALYDILNMDFSDWYNTILPVADSSVTLKEFRDSFFSYCGVEQETVTLVNDSMTVTRTIDPSRLSGQTVLTAICEINGCFGHMGRDGKFQYIILKEMTAGLYPSATLYPREDLFPAGPKNAELIGKNNYISCKYEDAIVERIDKLQIRQEEDDIGCIYGTGDNCYVVEDNFLLYGKSTEELQDIAKKMYSVISVVWYRPAQVEARGNPCLEVGDGIRLATKYEIVYTYILQRTLKGIQALRDSYTAEGQQYRGETSGGIHEQIVQLKGKANRLSRTIEETRLEMSDLGEGLSNSIKITADALNAEIIRAQGSEGELSLKINATAEGLSSKVGKNDIISSINQSAEEIAIEASKINLNGLVTANDYFKILQDGSIEAISGKIGGMAIEDYHLYWNYGGNSAGMSALTHGPAFWAGASFENRNEAPFMVYHNGKVTCKDLEAEQYVKTKKLEAEYLTAQEINATYLTVNDIKADRADISLLKSDMANINELVATKITADNVTADLINSRFANTEATLTASRVEASSLHSEAVLTSSIQVQGTVFTPKQIAIGGTTYTILSA